MISREPTLERLAGDVLMPRFQELVQIMQSAAGHLRGCLMNRLRAISAILRTSPGFD